MPGIQISANFDLGSGIPLDSRLVQATITTRNALDTITQRYQGMEVFVVSTQKNYQLRGGVADTNWVELLDAGGEPALGPPGGEGYVLSSTVAGARSWILKNSDLSYRATNNTYFSEINYNRVHINTGSFDVMYLNPFELTASSVAPYIFDTATAHNTAGDLLVQVKNNGTEKLSIDKDGNVNIPTGATYMVNGAPFSVTPTYTNAAGIPSPGLGGVVPGRTFDHRTIQQMFDELLYPYQNPVFSNLSITGQATTLEIGQSITSGFKDFTWASTNDANINTGTIVIKDENAGVAISAGLAVTPKTANLDINGAKTVNGTNVAYGTQQWSIYGTNSNSVVTGKAYFTVTWHAPFYYGVGAAGLTGAAIQALTKPALAAKSDRTYYFSPSGQKFYFAYPVNHGLLRRVDDINTFDNLPAFGHTTQTFTINGVSIDYYVYEYLNLTSASNAPLTFRF